jgi:hypothetical protein
MQITKCSDKSAKNTPKEANKRKRVGRTMDVCAGAFHSGSLSRKQRVFVCVEYKKQRKATKEVFKVNVKEKSKKHERHFWSLIRPTNHWRSTRPLPVAVALHSIERQR